jgi:hypothetical protein
MRRRQLIILLLGCSSLIAITCIGTSLESIVALLHPTNSIQTVQVSLYRITLQVVPNPPVLTQPADLALQIVYAATQQLVTSAHVSIEADMESMDMSTNHVNASQQSNGTYFVRISFAMSGIWQLRVIIAVPGRDVQSVLFKIAV